MFEDLICPICGGLAGIPSLPGDPCRCGGRFEDIDPGILKALLPFAPARVVPEFRLRVWEMRHGVPVNIGVLDDINVSEAEFIDVFRWNMPAAGESPRQFKLRVIDKNHKEIGTEFTLHIPWDHPALTELRAKTFVTTGIPAPTRIVESVRYSTLRFR